MALNSEFQLRDFVEAVAKVTTAAVLVADRKSPRRTCVECIHFDKVHEGCSKAGGNRPPAKVIAYGCELFKSDDIPY